MQIYFNEELLSYNLGDEKNLLDVVVNAFNIIENHNLITVEIKVDGKSYIPGQDEEFDNLSLDKIKSLNFSLINIIDYKISEISAILKQIEDILGFIESEDKKSLLKIDPERLVEDINMFLELPTDDLVFLLNDTQLLKGNLANDKLPILIEGLNYYIEIIHNRLKELENPEEEFNNVLNEITKMSSKIEQVSVQLQTGENMKAINTIFQFVLIIERCVRLSSILKNTEIYKDNEKNLKEFFENLNAKLVELLEAFTNEDFILVGDIFEYEISPLLEELDIIIDKKI